MSHTNGPTRVVSSDNGSDDQGFGIYDADGHFVGMAVTEPDAHLFAKAREMLEAVQDYLSVNNEMDKAMEEKPLSTDEWEEWDNKVFARYERLEALLQEVKGE